MAEQETESNFRVQNSNLQGSVEPNPKFLIYSMGGELYGSPLLSIREVLEFQVPKIMPNMVSYFTGVINVRGAIVGVVDLRTKFGISPKEGRKNPLLLCDTHRGTIAAIVDSVDRVEEIIETQIDRNPPICNKVEQKYFIGLARTQESLITIFDLEKLLTEQEFKKVSGE